MTKKDEVIRHLDIIPNPTKEQVIQISETCECSERYVWKILAQTRAPKEPHIKLLWYLYNYFETRVKPLGVDYIKRNLGDENIWYSQIEDLLESEMPIEYLKTKKTLRKLQKQLDYPI